MEHLAPVRSRVSAIVVTTSQAVALLDAIKCLSFTRTVSLPVLGLIENMSGYVCPCCGEVSNVFSTGGGASLAEREGLDFLGSMPIDTELVTVLDAAESEHQQTGTEDEAHRAAEEQAFEVLRKYQATSSAKLFQTITAKVIDSLANGLPAVTPGPIPET
jgi:hypothetical protein